MIRSANTTVAGIGAILAAIGGALQLVFDGDPGTNPEWALVVAAITAGVGLIWSRSESQHQADRASGQS